MMSEHTPTPWVVDMNAHEEMLDALEWVEDFFTEMFPNEALDDEDNEKAAALKDRICAAIAAAERGPIP